MTLWVDWVQLERSSALHDFGWGCCHLGAQLCCNVQDAYSHDQQLVLAVGWELNWAVYENP